MLRKFLHLFIGNRVQAMRVRNDTGVGRIYPVHVRTNLAAGAECSSQGRKGNLGFLLSRQLGAAFFSEGFGKPEINREQVDESQRSRNECRDGKSVNA